MTARVVQAPMAADVPMCILALVPPIQPEHAIIKVFVIRFNHPFLSKGSLYASNSLLKIDSAFN